MAQLTSSVEFANNTSYLLREGGAVFVRLTSGIAVPFNADEVVQTRVTVWCPTGNVYVAGEDGADIDPVAGDVPLPESGPYQAGSEKRTVVSYDGQPVGDSWVWNIQLRSRPWAYSDEKVYFKVELLRDNETVYADNGREIGGQIVYPHVQLRLTTSAGAIEQPDSPSTGGCRAIGSGSILVWYTTPVSATSTKVYYAASKGGSQTLIGTYGVGVNAWFVHSGLSASTDYFYYAKCENSEGDSEVVYLGTEQTYAVPDVPDAPTITSVLSPNANTVVVTFDPSDEVALASGVTAPNSYRLYGRQTSFPDAPENYAMIQVDGDARHTSVNWLDPETSYTVYMTAVNDGGESAGTAKVAVTTPAGGGVPVQPAGMTVTAVDHETLTVSWTMSESNEIGFGLYYSLDESTWTSVQSDAPLPAGTRSWTQTGLTAGTTYYWRVFSFNYVAGTLTKSDYTEASGATDAAPAQPDAVTEVGTLAINNHSIRIFWLAGTNNTQLAFKVYRGATLIATVPGNVLHATDYGLDENTTYTYRVDSVGAAGDVTGATANGTTLENTQTLAPVCGFEFHADSRNRIKEVSGRALITSDRDRWVSRTGTSWYKAGLRPIRGTVTLAKASGGVLIDGVYRVYLMLARGETRSIPSEPSATVTINDTNRTLVVTPPLNGDSTEVECRDIGYNVNGDEITAADAWEIYLAEENQGQAYRIARLPMAVADWEDTEGSGTYTISNALTLNDIFGGTRRPMEQELQNSLPPSCWEIENLGNRCVCTGEVDVEIPDGAELQISEGQDYFDVTGMDLGDGCVYHRLWIDKLDTGWEIWDYDEDTVDDTIITRAYIRHSDPAINAAGFNGLTGTYTDFAIKGNPDRVYFSGFYSGEATGGLTYSPETYPPLTIAEAEFFPDDNNSVESLVAVGELLLAGKDEKWIVASGGNEPDLLQITTRCISRGSGLNAIYSVARDANDTVYYLGDTGPFRVTAGGVQKVNIAFGNQRLFTEVFDISSVPNAKGAWFSREDWYVVTGLNRIGRTGNRDGFIMDVRNQAVMPFSTPYEITHIKEYKNSGGEFQLMFGAEDGKLGYLFKKGLYVDGADYTQDFALMNAEPIRAKIRTGILDTEQALTPSAVQPRIKAFPHDAGFECVLAWDGKERNGDPDSFEVTDWVEFTTDDNGQSIRLPSSRCDQLQFEISFSTRIDKPNAYFELTSLPVDVVVRHAS